MRKSSRNSGSKGDNKRSRPTRRSSSVLGPRIVLEWLEERILLSEDLLYSAVDNRPLTLRAIGDSIQVVPTEDPSTVLASRPISLVSSGLEISSAGYGVNLTIDTSVPQVPGGILFDGSGSSTLSGPGVDSTWTVTGAGDGWLGSAGYVEFQGVENLVGAANNQDKFVFEPSGSLSGSIDGGAGGYDTMVVQGNGSGVLRSVATGPNSGRISLGTKQINYAGLEPILVTGVPDVQVQGTSGDDGLVVEQDPGNAGNIRVRSTTGTLESVSFSKTGLNSLSVDALGRE